MANFRTHISFSTMLGAGYGGVAYALYDMPVSTCLLAGGLCSVSGMLPDIDSGPGKPLRESLAFAAAVVPMMLVDRFERMFLSHEAIILAGAGVYLFIRFVIARLLRAYTVHRGMFHSIPAAIIFGELAFLLASGDDVRVRIYKAGAVLLGYLSHLVLDELFSIEWYRGRLRLKKSFGTALKLVGNKWWPNLSTFAKLAILTYVVIHEPGWMHEYFHRHVRPGNHDAATAESGPAANETGTELALPTDSARVATDSIRRVAERIYNPPEADDGSAQWPEDRMNAATTSGP